MNFTSMEAYIYDTISNILVLTINALVFWLSYLILASKSNRPIKIIFITLAISSIIWIDTAYTSRLLSTAEPAISLILLKIAWAVTPVLFLTIPFFIKYTFNNFSNKNKKIPTLITSALTILPISVSILLFDSVIKSIEATNNQITIIYGPYIIPFLLLISGLIIWSSLTTLGIYKKAASNERLQLNYILYGLLVFYLANAIFNIAFPIFLNISQYYYLGDYSLLFLVIFFAIAILKTNLLSIQISRYHTVLLLVTLLLAINIGATNSSIETKIVTATSFALLFAAIAFVAKRNIQSTALELKRYTKKINKLLCLEAVNNSLLGNQLYILNSNTPDTNTTKSILELAKDMQGSSEQRYTFQPYYLISIFNEIEQSFQKNKKPSLKTSYPDNIPAMLGSKILLTEALAEVVSYLCKYTKQETINIVTSYKKNADHITISIPDAEFNLTHNTFDKINTTLKAANLANINTSIEELGLFLANKIIQLHDGHIHLKHNQEVNKFETIIHLPLKPTKYLQYAKESFL